jgi:hypothetical protein
MRSSGDEQAAQRSNRSTLKVIRHERGVCEEATNRRMRVHHRIAVAPGVKLLDKRVDVRVVVLSIGDVGELGANVFAHKRHVVHFDQRARQQLDGRRVVDTCASDRAAQWTAQRADSDDATAASSCDNERHGVELVERQQLAGGLLKVQTHATRSDDQFAMSQHKSLGSAQLIGEIELVAVHCHKVRAASRSRGGATQFALVGFSEELRSNIANVAAEIGRVGVVREQLASLRFAPG